MFLGFIDFIVAPTLAVCGDVISLVVGEKAEEDHQVHIFLFFKHPKGCSKLCFRTASGWAGYKIFYKRENDLPPECSYAMGSHIFLKKKAAGGETLGGQHAGQQAAVAGKGFIKYFHSFKTIVEHKV